MFGIPPILSKQTFLKKNIVPANDNDSFNDNKCIICWEPYDDQHPGVRVLPCNHVFGQGCLLKLIDRPNGDKCPLCRATFFRPLTTVIADLILVTGDKVLVIWHALPAWLRTVLRFLLNFDNVFYYVELLVDGFTNLRPRNPDLDLHIAVLKFWILLREMDAILTVLDMVFWRLNWRFRLRHCVNCTGLYVAVLNSIATTVFAMSSLMLGWHGTITNWRDRAVFFFLVLAAILLSQIVPALLQA